MPTGYTAAIKDGVSFEKFVWSCARGMGALIMMRDERSDAPIPERFEPGDYNAKEANKARAELARLLVLPIDQVLSEAESAYTSACECFRLRMKEKLDLRNKYSEMLAQVVQWKPPTPDHLGFQEFMVDQLRQSIDFDCNDAYDKEPERQDATAWHNMQITEAQRRIAYHDKAQTEENERTESRNKWLAELRKSVSASEPFTASE